MDKYTCVETGEVFNSAREASDAVCGNYEVCYECPLYDETHRYGEFCTNNLAEEAFIELYEECGFEKVEEKEQSRLAEILGVNEDQEWTIKDIPGIIHRIHLGERQWRKKDAIIWETCPQETVLAAVINNPDLIRSADAPQWTEREIEIAKAWKMMNPDMTQFSIVAVNQEEVEIDGIPLKEELKKCPNFFAAQKEMDVKVKDILGESYAV